MSLESWTLPGTLVALPLKRKRERPLDGFLAHGTKANRHLAVFVHGMGGNFYRSVFKKTMMEQCRRSRFDVLSFNNRGYENQVASETFRDCLQDLDAALAFGVSRGYRTFTLIGHSTGCQKITYYQAVRKRPDVTGLVLAAIGDDYAICRRDLGPRYGYWVRRARQLVEEGKGDTRLPAACLGFEAARFLSVAIRDELEASLFDFEGPMKHFRRIATPMLALFPAEEQFACIPVEEMADILEAKTRSADFERVVIPDADHSFHGQEKPAVLAISRWITKRL